MWKVIATGKNECYGEKGEHRTVGDSHLIFALIEGYIEPKVTYLGVGRAMGVITKTKKIPCTCYVPIKYRDVKYVKNKMDKEINLTDEEKVEILRMRKEKDNEQRTKEYTLNILQIAHDYAKWLIDNGAGTSYSTFCDEFGYIAKHDEDRPHTYEMIIRILKEVNLLM